MPSNRKFRPWMLTYTILFAVMCGWFVHDDASNKYPVAYTVWAAFIYIVIFAGNAFYSLGHVTALIRTAWKFIFPIVILQFVMSGIVDSRFGKHAQAVTTTISVLSWITGAALFFPTFRAHFLLGFGDILRVREIDLPVTANPDPLNGLLIEIRKLTRTTQTLCLLAILLLTALVLNSYFQVHFEKTDDSWVTVRRLADDGKYEAALTVARRMVEKDPSSPQIWDLMGNIQLSLGQLHQAEASFARAYELLPNEFNANLLNAVRKRIDETEPTPTPSPIP